MADKDAMIKVWHKAERINGSWSVHCVICDKVKPVWNDEGTGIENDIPEHCNPVCKDCAESSNK